MKDIIDQYKKEKTQDIDLLTLLPEVYYPLIKVFSKKKSNLVPPYRKNNFRIKLEKGKYPD